MEPRMEQVQAPAPLVLCLAEEPSGNALGSYPGGGGRIRAGALAVVVREGKSPGPTCTSEAALL